jgi:hypothetical protein
MDVQHEFRAWHIDRGGNGHAHVFVERAAVEHDQIGTLAHKPIELVGSDAGCFVFVLDEFSESFTGNVDAREQLKAGTCPRCDTAAEDVQVGVAMPSENGRGTLGETVGVIAQHDAGITPRHQSRHAQFEAAQGQRACVQEMTAGKDQLLTQV